MMDLNILIEDKEFNFGQFDYITDTNKKIILKNAFDAITLTKKWDFIKKDIINFHFCTEPEINTIANKMLELGYIGHSAYSFNWTMKQMQFIAKFGEEKFKENYINNKNTNTFENYL